MPRCLPTRLPVFLLACLPLIAGADPAAIPPAEPPATAEAAAPAVPAPPRLAYGLLVKQGEKILFAPCRDRSYALLEDVSPGQTVTRGLQQVGLNEGRKLYVELVGSVEGVALKASGLNLARADGRCQQPGGTEEHWRAGGQAPGWLLAAGSERVTLRHADGSDHHWPARDLERQGAQVRFQARAGDERLELHFDQALCADPAAEAVFGWTATVIHNDRTLRGCAWQR